jgi:hypothetical protein
MNTQPIACNLTAIPASVREEHIISAPKLFEAAQEVQELPNGYAVRFLSEPGRLMTIAGFIENERLCCSFFNFRLDIEPNNGPLWLRLTGADGVKELLKTTLLGSIEDKATLKQLIQTGGDAVLDELVAKTSLPILKTA